LTGSIPSHIITQDMSKCNSISLEIQATLALFLGENDLHFSNHSYIIIPTYVIEENY
jgi:hypothetical protein